MMFLKRVHRFFRGYSIYRSLENLYNSTERDYELQNILYSAYERKIIDREYTRQDNGWMYVVFSELNRDLVCLFEITVKAGRPILKTLLPFELVNATAEVNAEVMERLSYKSGFGQLTQEQSSSGKIRYYLVQPLSNLKRRTLKRTLQATLNEFFRILRTELDKVQQELLDDAALYREHSGDDKENGDDD